MLETELQSYNAEAEKVTVNIQYWVVDTDQDQLTVTIDVLLKNGPMLDHEEHKEGIRKRAIGLCHPHVPASVVIHWDVRLWCRNEENAMQLRAKSVHWRTMLDAILQGDVATLKKMQVELHEEMTKLMDEGRGFVFKKRVNRNAQTEAHFPVGPDGEFTWVDSDEKVGS
jgi:hypothetical protein